MKQYKPTYFLSLPLFCAEFFIIFIPSIVCIDILSACIDHTPLGQFTAAAAVVGPMMFVLFSVISFLLSRIGKLLSKDAVWLGQNEVFYRGKTLPLDSIRYITVHLPEIRSRSSSSPLELTIWADDKHCIILTRPSIELIFQLKKQCLYAKFGIDNIPSRLKQNGIIAACMAVVVVVSFLFGWLK